MSFSVQSSLFQRPLRRVAALLTAGAYLLGATGPALAVTYVNGAWTITTNGSATQMTDSYHLGPNAVVRVIDAGGVNGGSVIVNIPNGGFFKMDPGSILDASAGGANGAGGSLIFNQLGMGTILINGLIKANGLGTGAGGRISFNASDVTIGQNAIIQALGGANGGLGGRIDLRATDGLLQIGRNALLTTAGVSDAAHNLITIEGQGVEIDGQIVADGTAGNGGGTLRLIADNGRIRILQNGDLLARGNGAGKGGTVELAAHRAGTALDISTCTDACDDSGSLVKLHDNARVNVAGGNAANTGVIRIGRAGGGDIRQNMTTLDNGQMTGAGTVSLGEDAGNTQSVTLSNYDVTRSFGGSGAKLALASRTGDITATDNNNFGDVSAATDRGRIALTDTTGGMTASVYNELGKTALLAANDGTITLRDTVAGGDIDLGVAHLDATDNVTLGRVVSIHGANGTGSAAQTVTLANRDADLNITELNAGTADISVTGGGHHLRLENVTVPGVAKLAAPGDITLNDAIRFGAGKVTLQAGGDIWGMTPSMEFGQLTTVSGRNVSLFDRSGGFVLDGVSATGNLILKTDANNAIVLNNATVGGVADIQTWGQVGTISGSGNVFKGNTYLHTHSWLGGHITLSGDFQGPLEAYGDTLNLTDTAGDFTISNLTTGMSAAPSYIRATGANGSLNLSSYDLSAAASGRIEVEATKNITYTQLDAAPMLNERLVLNSTNGGNIRINNVYTMRDITAGTAPYSVYDVPAGLSMSTRGGDFQVEGLYSTAGLNVTGTGNLRLGTLQPGIVQKVQFNVSGDAILNGQFGESVGGTASRISILATHGNLTAAGLTATGTTGWGAANETLVAATYNGDVLGSGLATTGGGNMRLQAGDAGHRGGDNDINVANVKASNHLALYATGTDGGNSVKVAGDSRVGGHITATGISLANAWEPLTGRVDLSLASGDLTTALLWSNTPMSLIAKTGSILQDTSAYRAYSSGVAGGKTIWTGGGDLTLVAGGRIDTGIMAGSTLVKAGGIGPDGVSVSLRGRTDGNLTVTATGGGNVRGDVYLGTGIGASAEDLEDSPATVMDVYGVTRISADGTIKAYGSLNGPVHVTGSALTGTLDKGDLHIAGINLQPVSALNDTGLHLAVLRGMITGGNLATASGQNVFLQAGSLTPRDAESHIDLKDVSVGGDLEAVAAGSDDGTPAGRSIVITGNVEGEASAQGLDGTQPSGTVSLPR